MFKRKTLVECLEWLETNIHSHMYQLISSPDIFILLGRCGLCFGRILSFEVVITLFSFLYECQVYITFHFPFCLPKPFNFPSSLHKYLINNYDVLSYSKHGLCTYRTGIIWELIRKILGPHLESGSLGDWAPNICFNQLSRWFLYILKFEKHQLKFDWLHFTWDTF